jgi:tRNA nucleotidyltransferase (CCA-adding enzyme)
MSNNAISSFFQFFSQITNILNAIKQAGGTPYLVGGCVRDLVLGRELKDFDIEVHKLDLDILESILKKFGPVKLVGKKFGVLRIAHMDIDWSLPRRDSKGRKPTVIIEPTMTIQDACRRRDLTMNAMAIDLNFVVEHTEAIKQKLLPQRSQNELGALIAATFNIIDSYGGLDDIKHNRLRAVDEKLFLEDPLRFFRVMQFIGRFNMQPDKQLDTLCASMDLFDTTTETPLACERIYEEIKKLFLKSHSPSQGFRWLVKIGRLKEI